METVKDIKYRLGVIADFVSAQLVGTSLHIRVVSNILTVPEFTMVKKFAR